MILIRTTHPKENFNEKIIVLYMHQFSSKKISKNTLNKRLCGIAIVKEVFETGNYKWKVTRSFEMDLEDAVGIPGKIWD